jgi:glyoxylase-like metal-dependent hydrolase (beta-lactamase superfamily II)
VSAVLLLGLMVFLVLVLAALLWWLGRPDSPGQSGDLRLHAVAPGIYLFRAYFSNAVVFELENCVILVDTLISPQSAGFMRDAIAQTIGKPVTHVVLTHYHGDHIGGTSVFPDAELIASEDTARFMVERDMERRQYTDAFGLIARDFPAPRVPNVLFDQEHRLDVDGHTFEILRVGAAETSDACVVWWPARRALAAGDGVSTAGYPFLGAPVADEGLRGDGQWVSFLDAVGALEPAFLLPGHGPALVGVERIRSRLLLLRSLMTDVIETVRELAKESLSVPEVVEQAEKKLAAYGQHPELVQNVTTQRFAIYRAINSLDPERRGKGWWDDLRPQILRDAKEEDVRSVLNEVTSKEELQDRMRRLMGEGRPLLLRSVAIEWLETHSEDAETRGLLALLMLQQVSRMPSIVEGSDFFKEARSQAELGVSSGDSRSLLVMGILEVWSAVLLGQHMAPGLALLERAISSSQLDGDGLQMAHFFMGKAHQYELREKESDTCLRKAMPWWLRGFYTPFFKTKLRSTP